MQAPTVHEPLELRRHELFSRMYISPPLCFDTHAGCEFLSFSLEISARVRLFYFFDSFQSAFFNAGRVVHRFTRKRNRPPATAIGCLRSSLSVDGRRRRSSDQVSFSIEQPSSMMHALPSRIGHLSFLSAKKQHLLHQGGFWHVDARDNHQRLECCHHRVRGGQQRAS